MRADERLVALHLDDDVEVVRAEMFTRRRRAPGDEKAVGLRASLGSVGALARGSNDAPAEGFDGVDDAVVVCGDAAVVDALGALGGFVREAHERLAANLREGLAREALAVESRGDHGEDATLSGREGWRRARGGWVRWVASRGRGARERVKRREMGGWAPAPRDADERDVSHLDASTYLRSREHVPAVLPREGPVVGLGEHATHRGRRRRTDAEVGAVSSGAPHAARPRLLEQPDERR